MNWVTCADESGKLDIKRWPWDQRWSNIRFGSAAYFCIIAVLGYFPMYGGASGGDETWRVTFVLFLPNELGWFDISPKSRHCLEIR